VAASDWTSLPDGLDAVSLKRGVTTGVARANGGGNFCFAWNSTVATAGTAGLYAAQANFAPMAKGGSIRGAIQRGAGGGPLNFAPFLFIGLASPSVGANGYLLGLDDDDPHRVVLRKGALNVGLPAVSIGTQGILLQGTETFLNATWLHIRLDMIVNTNGDVILQCFRNDLTQNPVTTPVWNPLAGANQFIDDALGINSGSAPYTSGYAGFGFATKDVTRRGYQDHIEVLRQL